MPFAQILQIVKIIDNFVLRRFAQMGDTKRDTNPSNFLMQISNLVMSVEVIRDIVSTSAGSFVNERTPQRLLASIFPAL